MRRLAALALLLAASPAQANYTYDPADLPKGFTCDAEWSAERCAGEQRSAAWWNRYEDRYDNWYNKALFDTDIYFTGGFATKSDEDPSMPPWDPETELARETPNLVDAIYQVALRRFSAGWAFAVDMVCEQGDTGCVPKLRMVSLRGNAEIPPDLRERYRDFLPTSEVEVDEMLSVTAKWEEADLRSCPGALDQLLRLPPQRGGQFWHPAYVQKMRGKQLKELDEFFVTADGSGVFLRARSHDDPSSGHLGVGDAFFFAKQWNGGEGMAWAVDMAEVVRPCLKPATAPAPWERATAIPATAAAP